MTDKTKTGLEARVVDLEEQLLLAEEKVTELLGTRSFLRTRVEQLGDTGNSLQAEVRRYEGELDRPGNALLANLHGSWEEVQLAIEYRAADIDCEGDGDGEGTDTDPQMCKDCRERAKAEVRAFMAISAMLKGTLLAARDILHIYDPQYLPVAPVKPNLDRDIRGDMAINAWDSCMAMVPVGTFGPYKPVEGSGHLSDEQIQRRLGKS